MKPVMETNMKSIMDNYTESLYNIVKETEYDPLETDNNIDKKNLSNNTARLENSFFNDIYTTMNFDLSNIFSELDLDPDDGVATLLYDLSPSYGSPEYINLFDPKKSIGTKNKAKQKGDGANYHIWWKQNRKIKHAFSKVLHKLICCTGKVEGDYKKLLINIPTYNKNYTKVTLTEKQFFIKIQNCKNLEGLDYNDDNLTKEGSKPACLDFMVKYCLFLKKYFPNETDRIKKSCACILNDKNIHNTDPELVNTIINESRDNNVKCTVSECKSGESSYRPGFMREQDCRNISICTQNIGNMIVQSGADISGELKANYEQNCDVNTQNTEPEPSVEDETEINKDDQNEINNDTRQDLEQQSSESQSTSQQSTTQPTYEVPTIQPTYGEPTPGSFSFIQSIIDWFSSIFTPVPIQENFSNGQKNSNIFFYLYLIFSVVIINLYIFNDALKIKKILKFIK